MNDSGPRVAIDLRTLQERPVGGVGRSVRGALPELLRRVRLTALLDARLTAPAGMPPELTACALRAAVSSRGFAWLQFAAPAWLRSFDGLFHCPFYGLPYRQPVPMVVTVADLSFEFAPQWFPAANRLVFVRQARWAARTARRTIVYSEHVRDSLLERYARFGARPELVSVIRLPVEQCFAASPAGAEQALCRLGLRPPFVVALGGAPRRRLSTAIEAWERARRALGATPEELPLAVVGRESPGAHPGVIGLGVLDDSDWAAVLSGAEAFCYATEYEGYGMPAIEAAACATPVVGARVGSLPELLGAGAQWSADPSAAALGEALAGVLRDRRLAARISREGLVRVRALPSWSQVAAATAHVYRDALGS